MRTVFGLAAELGPGLLFHCGSADRHERGPKVEEQLEQTDPDQELGDPSSASKQWQHTQEPTYP